MTPSFWALENSWAGNDPKSLHFVPQFFISGYFRGHPRPLILRPSATPTCPSNGSLFYKKSLNMGPVFYKKKSLNMGPITWLSPNFWQVTKFVKNGPIFQEKSLKMCTLFCQKQDSNYAQKEIVCHASQRKNSGGTITHLHVWWLNDVKGSSTHYKATMQGLGQNLQSDSLQKICSVDPYKAYKSRVKRGHDQKIICWKPEVKLRISQSWGWCETLWLTEGPSFVITSIFCNHSSQDNVDQL